MKRGLSILVLLVVLGMSTVVPAFAGPPEGAGHQRAAADLKGDVAKVVPCHVAGVQCPD